MGIIPLEHGDPKSFDVLGHPVSQYLGTTQKPGFESWFHSQAVLFSPGLFSVEGSRLAQKVTPVPCALGAVCSQWLTNTGAQKGGPLAAG